MQSWLLAMVLFGIGGSGIGLQVSAPGDSPPPDPQQVEWASQIKARYEPTFLQVPGVVGTGISRAPDTGEVVIQVYVTGLDARIRQAIPAQVEGVRVQLIATGEFTAR